MDGERLLVFDSKSEKYTVCHSGGEQMKEKWKNDKELTKFLKSTSKGDCTKWLKNLVHCKKEPETTGIRDDGVKWSFS